MPNDSLVGNTHYAAILENIQAHRDTHRRLLGDLRHFELSLSDRLARSSSGIESQIRKLVELSRRFLNASLATSNSEMSAHFLAAVEYFLEEDDTNPDFGDYDGFDDDLEIFKLVAKKHSVLELLEGLVAAA